MDLDRINEFLSFWVGRRGRRTHPIDIDYLYGSSWISDVVIEAFLTNVKQTMGAAGNSFRIVGSAWFDSRKFEYRMKEGVYLPDASIGYDVNGFPIEVPFLDCETILIAPVHVPGHWNGLAIDFAKRLFVYYEPYGAYLNRESNIHVIKSWLIERDARVGIDTASSPWTFHRLTSPSLQTDGTSCGILVCMAFFYLMMFSRYPTKDDYSQDDVCPRLRCFVAAMIDPTAKSGAPSRGGSMSSDMQGMIDRIVAAVKERKAGAYKRMDDLAMKGLIKRDERKDIVDLLNSSEEE